MNRLPGSVLEYESILSAMDSRLGWTNGMQPGNPSLAVERILDIVHRTGPLAGNTMIPLRVVLGSDVMALFATNYKTC